jgi:succinyl-CoA synthetase beta subunit
LLAAQVLIIGGGIANFTDVAETFKGIVKAIRHFQERLRMHKVKIYVRRGGPNYQEGLRAMRESVESMVRHFTSPSPRAPATQQQGEEHQRLESSVGSAIKLPHLPHPF